MAVASRLAVARVSPEGACPAAAGRSGLAAFPTARIGTRRGGAVAANPPRCTVEAVQMTEPLTKEDLVAYLVPRCKAQGELEIRDILNGLAERFNCDKIMEENNVIDLKQGKQSISLQPGGQLELSGAPLETLHQTCAEVNSHLYQVNAQLERKWE